MGINPHPKEEVERCIRVLEDVARGTTNSEQALMSIQGTVRSLRNGDKVYEMIAKLVRSNNPDRAAKLLKVAGENRGFAGKKVRFAILGTLNVLIVLGGISMMPRCSGAYDPAMAAINACPAAVQLLGAPIEQSIVGLACGSSESSGAYGQASWQIAVHGNRDSGQYEFAGRNQGMGWRLDTAMLKVGDQTVSVWPCGQAIAAASEGALTVGSNFVGTVISSVGHPAVQPNTPCTVSVSPTSADAVSAGYNCHIKVQCGTAVIYGWEGSGYTRCQVANGVAVRADDITGSASNDDPKLALNTAAKSCQVSDDGTAPFTVTIALTGI